MQKSLASRRALATLDDLGVLRFQGPDAVKFLQGQLSNDVSKLGPEHRSMLAGYHNPQGRAIALLRLVWRETEQILALFPRELVAPVAARLGKFVLRAKVTISDESENWRVLGILGEPPDDEIFIPLEANPARGWWLVPTSRSFDVNEYSTIDRETWRGLDIAAGLPQVYRATSEAFVAQMLNLDRLGAVAFDKGCYAGQEIIARAHYRGQVKRRLQRFHLQDVSALAPGDSGQLPDGRAFKTVEAVRSTDGGYDFLAVTEEV